MRKTLSKKESKQFLSAVEHYHFTFDKKDLLVHVKDEIGEYYLIRDLPSFFLVDTVLFPTLFLVLLKKVQLPGVYVDKGAIPFVTKGADVMRPGITAADAFPADAAVMVCDAEHKKPLAIGKALLSSADLLQQEKGKVIEVLHYVGDKLWKKGAGVFSQLQ